MRIFHRGNKKVHALRGALLGMAVAVGVTLLYAAGMLDRAEARFLDGRFVLRAMWHQPVDFGPVAVVAIDDGALHEVGRWPWPWKEQARLVDAIKEAGAAVIGLDILYPEPDPDPAGVARLVEAIRRANNVVLATSDEDISRPWSALRAEASGVGTISLLPDKDGVVRRLVSGESTGPWQPFAFELASVAGYPVGQEALPQPWIINYRPRLENGLLRRNGMVPTVSALQLLTEAASVDLRGKIVLVGVTAQGAHDFHHTPLMAGIPGVYLHAFALRSLLFADTITPPNTAFTIVTLWLLAVLFATGMFTLRPLFGAAGTAFTVTLILLWTGVMFVRSGIWLAVAPHVASSVTVFIASLVYAHRVVDKDERRVRHMFRRYVAPAVVDELLANDVVTEEGRRVTVTILFADIRGFTSYAEQVSPEEAMVTLDSYLRVMGAAVLEHGGTLDKYIGDAVMAVFGAPLSQPRHAVVAWRAALDMQRRVQALSGLRIGIGIHSGDVVVGSVGTALRREYTAIGDVVNVASRLEDVATVDEIVYSEKTRQLLALHGEMIEGKPEDIIINSGHRKITVYRYVARDSDGRCQDDLGHDDSDFSVL